MRTLLITGFLFFLFWPSGVMGQINEKRNLTETNHRIFHASYSPSGKYIATTGSDNNIILWNTESVIIYRTLVGLKKRPNQVVFSKDGRNLYSAGEDGLITTWDPALVQIAETTSGHSGPIKALAIDPSGTILVSAGEDRLVRVWRITSSGLNLVFEMKGHKKTINTLAISPDGRRAVSGGADRSLKLWDLQTGGMVGSVDAHEGWVRTAVFSPDGSHISSGGDDKVIRIWNARDLSGVRTITGHTGWVQSITYTASGKHIISGGHDATIRVWNASTGKAVTVSGKLEQIVLSVDASPVRNDFISSCLLSEKLRIWAYEFEPPMITQSGEEPDMKAPPGQTGPPEQIHTPDQDPGPEQIPDTEQDPITEQPPDPEQHADSEEAPASEQPAAEVRVPSITIFSPMTAEGRTTHDRPSILIVGKAEADDGIQTLLINKEMATLNEAGVFQGEVDLVKGDNLVELVAVSRRGKMSRDHILIHCTSDAAPLERSSAEEDVPAIERGRYYALIIGVEQYTDEKINDLDYPIRDADNLYRVLSDNYTFGEDDITFLKNPSRTEMIIAMDALGQRVTPEDNLLIFFAGHGFWDEKTGIGYWLPNDANRSNTANWFRNSTLRDFIGSIPSRHTLLIADACFSGSIFKTRGAFADPEHGVMKLHDLPSRKAMTSGALKEVPDVSVFVRHLIRELNNNQEPFLPSEQLFGNFKTAVLNNSPNVPQYGTIQNVGDQGGDFIFVRKK